MRGRFAALLLLGAVAVVHAGNGEPERGFPARVELGDELTDLKRLNEIGIDVDAVFDGWARIYVNQEQLAKLLHVGIEATRLPDPARAMAELAQTPGPAPKGGSVPAVYHTYATLTADLQTIVAGHPDIARLSSIGQSAQGRELWMMKLSRNPDVEEDEPEVAYLSSMHGDEVVGKELLFNLIDYLTDNDGIDPRVTAILDTTELWILPSMNPDGTELGQRWNANGTDLNRDFPDQFTDPVNTTLGREPETAVVMNWAALHSTDLGVNFHGGALVVNYPFDSNPGGSSTFSPVPDPGHDMLVSISRTYADNNPPMSVSNSHPAWDNGITNGADWYSINGGMQDWNYVWRGNFEVLVEVSTDKWPAAGTLPGFWDDNLESLLAYIERAQEGLRGVVTDAVTGVPLAAEIKVDADPFLQRSDPDVGDYHRLLVPGVYTAEFSALGYQTQTIAGIDVNAGLATRVDVALQPNPLELIPESACDDTGVDCDPWLDRSQPADLAVTLRNLGLAATSVAASLEPTGWFAEVTRSGAAYPDLITGASGQSLAPHHGVLLSAAAPDGHKVGFVVRWSAAQGAGVSDPFFVEIGSATCSNFVSTDVPQAILDNASLTSNLNVSGGLQIDEVRVTVDISHTFIGDLRIDLIAPDGTSVILHNHVGWSTDDIDRTYTPFEVPALGNLIGSPVVGTWTLRVVDTWFWFKGRLISWRLGAKVSSPIELVPASRVSAKVPRKQKRARSRS